jgi:hypothetical protein
LSGSEGRDLDIGFLNSERECPVQRVMVLCPVSERLVPTGYESDGPSGFRRRLLARRRSPAASAAGAKPGTGRRQSSSTARGVQGPTCGDRPDTNLGIASGLLGSSDGRWPEGSVHRIGRVTPELRGDTGIPSVVIAMLEWPKVWLTTLSGTPAVSIAVAQLRPREWNGTLGNAAAWLPVAEVRGVPPRLCGSCELEMWYRERDSNPHEVALA